MRCTITAISCLAFATAYAENDERAEALFEEGRVLRENGDWDAACKKFEEAHGHKPKPGIVANLAKCAERAGDYPRAWRLYVLAASKWTRDETVDVVLRDADAVAKKATMVVLQVPDPQVPGLEVTVNGRVVEPAREIRDVVEPGAIELVAKADGVAAWKKTVRGAVGETIVVEVALERTTDSRTPPTSTRRRRSRVYLSIGLGVGAVGAFATSFFVAKKASDDYDAILANDMFCMNGDCNDEGQKRVDDTQRRAQLGTIIGVAGGALAVGALVVFFTAPRDTVVTPVATGDGGGVAVSGRF